MYSAEEVEVCIESYLEVERLGLWRYRLIDIDRVFHRLPPKLRETVFLVGIAGLSFNQAAEYLDTDSTTVIRRYYNGLTWLTAVLNGRRPTFAS